ncbi:hypothetical protein Plim_2977 [Planctopirus limnophila DSM 3776]|uniref:Uncharacterized protein n=1 Tax=Planctopirus limnophila (strain ATCC 43296 / DSM 3776 / IFAM 1008 / Mu 290) TaxID=521674 RepID=D5SS75_PLAL2|nr:hypothetical protein Plim_2977 [Planctopirus limnophila DSM 3776]
MYVSDGIVLVNSFDQGVDENIRALPSRRDIKCDLEGRKDHALPQSLQGRATQNQIKSGSAARAWRGFLFVVQWHDNPATSRPGHPYGQCPQVAHQRQRPAASMAHQVIVILRSVSVAEWCAFDQRNSPVEIGGISTGLPGATGTLSSLFNKDRRPG